MSLNLLKVELSNIRSHRYVTFKPAKSGITALSGPNGSGKSTIVDSIVWVLYGTKPHGVSKTSSLVKDGVDVTKEKVYAKVFIRVDNTDIKVERRIINKTGSVECEVWEKPIDQEEFTEKDQKAGPSVSHAEPYIRQRLKMNEKGFLAAILVQQKQVDQLISATPKERAEVIEKLTGISSITKGLTEARQNYNTMKKTLGHFTVNEDEYNQMLKEHEGKEVDLEKYKRKLTTIKNKNDKNSQQYTKILNEIKVHDDNAEVYKINSDKKIVLTTRLESIEKDLQKSYEQKKIKKSKIDSLEVNGDYHKIEKELSNVRNKLMQITNSITNSNSKKNELSGSIKVNDENLKKLKLTDEKNVTLMIEETVQKISGIEVAIKNFKDNNIVAKTAISSLTNAIKTINDNAGKCPTCLQEVKDKTEALRTLREDIAKEEENIENNNNEINSLTLSLNGEKEKLYNLELALRLFEENSESKIIVNDLSSNLITLEADKIIVDKELKALERIFDEARQYKDIKDEYDRIAKETVMLSDQKESLQKELSDVEKTIRDSNFNTNVDISALRAKANTLTGEREVIQKDFNEYRELYVATETELKYLSENIKKAKDEIDRYAQLLESVETSGATVNVLEEFREERINNSVPVVSAYASDLLNRFTNGKFTQLILDKKFNASVTLSNGVTRSVGLLSGGELSSAAMSLRLAISLLLNKGSINSLLILDEVLVSMDEERSELILSTIKDIFNGQLVFISHGANTNDIADFVVEL